MREFKFRAWHHGKMYSNVFFNDEYIFEYLPDRHGSWNGFNASIDDVKLMQFIWLKDKNGKDIYEGDLLITDLYRDLIKQYPIHFKVIFDKGKFLMEGCGGKQFEVDKDSTIVGNIYENPKLFKWQGEE